MPAFVCFAEDGGDGRFLQPLPSPTNQYTTSLDSNERRHLLCPLEPVLIKQAMSLYLRTKAAQATTETLEL